MGVIYKIKSPSDKLYVGKTYNLRKRINAHKCSAKKGKNILLHNSIRKYGWDAHVLEVIEEVPDELMDEREMFWIKELGTYCYENKMGMNMTKGGDGQRTTWMHDIERRKWYSEKFKGENGSFYGRKHTEEAKKIISQKTREFNLRTGRVVPQWGVEKGRLKVIKAVICYNVDGVAISEHDSASDAAKYYSLSSSAVTGCCRGKNSGMNGKYTFRYKTEDSLSKIDVKINRSTLKRPVLVFTSKFKFLKEYPSSTEAAAHLNVPKTTINRAAMYNDLHPIRKGFIFVYKDEADKKFKEKGILIRT